MHVMNEVSLGGISIDVAYPVGSLYFSEGLNPNLAFPETAWIRRAQGRVLVGVDEADADYARAGQTGGAKTVTLAEGLLPAHSHPFTGKAVETDAAAHTHGVRYDRVGYEIGTGTGVNRADATGVATAGLTAGAGAHTHAIAGGANGAVSETGGGAAHNNLQPYSVCEIWERIA